MTGCACQVQVYLVELDTGRGQQVSRVDDQRYDDDMMTIDDMTKSDAGSSVGEDGMWDMASAALS